MTHSNLLKLKICEILLLVLCLWVQSTPAQLRCFGSQIRNEDTFRCEDPLEVKILGSKIVTVVFVIICITLAVCGCSLFCCKRDKKPGQVVRRFAQGQGQGQSPNLAAPDCFVVLIPTHQQPMPDTCEPVPLPGNISREMTPPPSYSEVFGYNNEICDQLHPI